MGWAGISATLSKCRATPTLCASGARCWLAIFFGDFAWLGRATTVDSLSTLHTPARPGGPGRRLLVPPQESEAHYASILDRGPGGGDLHRFRPRRRATQAGPQGRPPVAGR